MQYLVTYRWQDGEQEYFTRRFAQAEGQDEADQKATSYLKDMWADQTVEEDGVFMPPWGYPAVTVNSVQAVNTVEDVIRVIGSIDDCALNLTT